MYGKARWPGDHYFESDRCRRSSLSKWSGDRRQDPRASGTTPTMSNMSSPWRSTIDRSRRQGPAPRSRSKSTIGVHKGDSVYRLMESSSRRSALGYDRFQDFQAVGNDMSSGLSAAARWMSSRAAGIGGIGEHVAQRARK